MFGKTFLAGISIAAATLVTTIFVGLLVRGKYDELEASYFEAQDKAIDDLEMSTAVDAEVSDFFGSNLNPESAPPGGGSAGGPAERSDAPSAPAEKLP